MVWSGAKPPAGLGTASHQPKAEGIAEIFVLFARKIFCFPFSALCRRGELLSVRSDGK